MSVRNVTFIYKVTEHIKIMSAFIFSDWANTGWKSERGDGGFVEERRESQQGDVIVVPHRAELHPWEHSSMYPAEEQPGRLDNPWDPLWLSQQPAQEVLCDSSVLGVTHCSPPRLPHTGCGTAAALMLQLWGFLCPSEQGYTGMERLFINSEQKVLGFANPQRRISHEEGHHDALPTGNVSSHSKPCEDGNTPGCFPSQSHPGRTCCLTIDLQVNPMSPCNFLNRLQIQSTARREAGRCWITVASGRWRKPCSGSALWKSEHKH